MSETMVKAENAAELMRHSTDVASVCKAIVSEQAVTIQGKNYIRVEGWQSIAAAYGCVLSVRDVARIESGVRATGEVKRMSDGAVLATAEGFVGDDEQTWGGRMEYAKRAMAQTRAMSRAGRSAFAFVVTLMDAGLETTPFEEVPAGGFDNAKPANDAAPKPEPIGTPPASVESLGDGESVKMEKLFDRIEPPPQGKKANRIYFQNDPYRYTTMHKFEAVIHGDRLLVTIKASEFKNKMYYSVDGWEPVQKESLPLGDDQREPGEEG